METQRTESPHLTVADLAARWHTTKQGIYNKRHRRKAPRGFRNGRELLFPLAEVEEFERAGLDADPSNPDIDPVAAPVERKRGRARRRTAQPA